MSKVVRVAVVGYGGMGGWHTKRLQEIPGVVELAGVYDIKPERNKVAEENGIHAYSSFEELLADKTVDVVTVAIPNDQHKKVCIQVMEAGKVAISEKPVTLCTADLEEMIAASKRTSSRFIRTAVGTRISALRRRLQSPASSVVFSPFSPVFTVPAVSRATGETRRHRAAAWFLTGACTSLTR